MADAIARSKRFKGLSADDEYDHDGGVEMSDAKAGRQSEARKQQQARSAAASALKQQSSAAEKSEARFNRHKQLVIAIGHHVYLRLQAHGPRP